MIVTPYGQLTIPLSTEKLATEITEIFEKNLRELCVLCGYDFLFRERRSRQPAGCPRGLEVEPAGDTVDIQYFACEK